MRSVASLKKSLDAVFEHLEETVQAREIKYQERSEKFQNSDNGLMFLEQTNRLRLATTRLDKCLVDINDYLDNAEV